MPRRMCMSLGTRATCIYIYILGVLGGSHRKGSDRRSTSKAKCTDNRPQIGAKASQNQAKIDLKSLSGAVGRSWAIRGPPGMLPRRPGTRPGSSRDAPGVSRDALRALRDAPGTPRDVPKPRRRAFGGRCCSTPVRAPVFGSKPRPVFCVSHVARGLPDMRFTCHGAVETHVGPFSSERVGASARAQNRSEIAPEIDPRALGRAVRAPRGRPERAKATAV